MQVINTKYKKLFYKHVLIYLAIFSMLEIW